MTAKQPKPKPGPTLDLNGGEVQLVKVEGFLVTGVRITGHSGEFDLLALPKKYGIMKVKG